MSRRTDAKKARRRKRRAARDARWVPDSVMAAMSDDIELAAVLEQFDQRISERGWVFDDEASDDESALWCYPPSQADVGADDIVDMTTIVLTAADGTDVIHVVFVGTADDYQFGFEELFESLDVIEAYRHGDPRPQFD
ncbi:hypothetical protein [Mycolicibacterium pulveris]|uniref:hypothetical protein n=1 Tax=Mycolicibacterium pulveris TaxID=36813 RepID=UPI003CE6D4A1